MGIGHSSSFTCPQCKREIRLNSFFDHLKHMRYECPERDKDEGKYLTEGMIHGSD